MTGLISADIWKDPRVVADADGFWKHVRPGLVERLIDENRRLERMMGQFDTLDRHMLVYGLI